MRVRSLCVALLLLSSGATGDESAYPIIPRQMRFRAPKGGRWVDELIEVRPWRYGMFGRSQIYPHVQDGEYGTRFGLMYGIPFDLDGLYRRLRDDGHLMITVYGKNGNWYNSLEKNAERLRRHGMKVVLVPYVSGGERSETLTGSPGRPGW